MNNTTKLINKNTLYSQRLQRYPILNIVKSYGKNINIEAHKQEEIYTETDIEKVKH